MLSFLETSVEMERRLYLLVHSLLEQYAVTEARSGQTPSHPCAGGYEGGILIQLFELV